jgi:hypothetical protein
MAGEDPDIRWIARLTPLPGVGVERILRTSLGLDVWERSPDALVVRAYEGQLRELERRQLATVERRWTERDYLSEKESREES